VRAGIALLNHYRGRIDKLSRKYGIARGGDVYWRLVKLCHWIPSGPKKILEMMQAQGVKAADWESVRRFAASQQESLKASIKRDPVDGIAGVDRTFQQVDEWASKLKAR
jgi:hypothetical protein